MNQTKNSKVKNKSAAPIQITAEQIFRVALDNYKSGQPKPTGATQKIEDKIELEDYRLRKRQQYESTLSQHRQSLSLYYKYAVWEENQKDLVRTRSIYERAIDVDYREPRTWIKYAEMEMRNKNINLARNIWDRSVNLLPRITQLWLKYTLLEDMLGNYPTARAIFERWMKWHPEEQAWNSYIKFETRLNQLDYARNIFERYIIVYPTIKTWLKYAKFEEKHNNIDNTRSVFERSIKFFGENQQVLQDKDVEDEAKLYISFAKFEERFKEIERARVIYKYALDHIPKQKAKDLFETFTSFEKNHGDRVGIEDVIIGKKRFQYEEDVKKNPKNYDTWFDYTRLEETNGEVSKCREVYERSISNLPPTQEKKHWKRYIYLWINYAVFEELIAKDFNRARSVYQECLKLIPHKIFSFSKVWIYAAEFEIRQLNLEKARSIYGNAIGNYPKSKIFDSYIHLEMELGNFDRVRKLFEKNIELMPENCNTWNEYAQLEDKLGEVDRARSIYEIGISQDTLDTPESLWKSFIDFEIEHKQFQNTRSLYKRLLERTNHVKVWISYAQMELKANIKTQNTEPSRAIYEEANKSLKDSDKEERLMLLDSWKQFEETYGTPEQLDNITKRIPKRIIKRKIVTLPDGSLGPTEEYYDYIFPEEQSKQPNLKLLEMAQKWKKDQLNKK